jgi:hypothetical protein
VSSWGVLGRGMQQQHKAQQADNHTGSAGGQMWKHIRFSALPGHLSGQQQAQGSIHRHGKHTADKQAGRPLQPAFLTCWGISQQLPPCWLLSVPGRLPNGEHHLFVRKEQPLRSPEAATPASSSKLSVWKLAPLLVRGTSGVCKTGALCRVFQLV